MDYKALYEAQLKEDQKQAWPRAIAKHLAQVALYELTGKWSLYPDLRTKYDQLSARMRTLGHPITLTEGFRTAKRQNTLYAQVPKVTNAKALESWHQAGLAMDVISEKYLWNAPASFWTLLGKEGKALGLTWGGDFPGFPDKPHFELPISTDLKTLRNSLEMI